MGPEFQIRWCSSALGRCWVLTTCFLVCVCGGLASAHAAPLPRAAPTPPAETSIELPPQPGPEGAHADRVELRLPQPWDLLGQNLLDAFTGPNLLWHTGGVAATALLVTSNADYQVHHFFAEHETLGYVAVPGLIAGYAAPFLVAAGLY